MEDIGRNVNKNDVVNKNTITLNSSTSTKILDANERRITVLAINQGPQRIWLKFQPASVDNLKDDDPWLDKGDVFEMIPDNIYTGEISAIADSGTPSITIEEY